MEIHNYATEDFICDESFQRYCLGTDQPDIEFWEAWIMNNPHRLESVQEAIRVISVLNANQGNLQVQLNHLKDGIQRFDLLKDALQNENNSSPSFALNKKRSIPWFRYLSGIAASLMILAVAGYFLLRPAKIKIPGKNTDSAITIIRSGNEPRKTVVLPDGSVVTLRNNSSITLVKDFNTANRELILSGEAFFDVSHHEQHPFIVHTQEVNIEVLGTVFNVSAYPGDTSTETSLFRGKVSVSVKGHPDQKVILTPNRKLIFVNGIAGKTSRTVTSAFHVVPMSADPVSHKAKEIAWIRNRLKIEDEPLTAIADKLQKWYGIEISFTDEDVKKYRYSGTFESETVVKALEALQLSYPFNFQVDKEKIIISK